VVPQELDAVMPLVLCRRTSWACTWSWAGPDLPPVLCDVTMVEQVLLNLARNGMQAMDLPSSRSVG
jgi:two-component system sensor histidine kinase DctS